MQCPLQFDFPRTLSTKQSMPCDKEVLRKKLKQKFHAQEKTTALPPAFRGCTLLAFRPSLGILFLLWPYLCYQNQQHQQLNQSKVNQSKVDKSREDNQMQIIKNRLSKSRLSKADKSYDKGNFIHCSPLWLTEHRNVSNSNSGLHHTHVVITQLCVV